MADKEKKELTTKDGKTTKENKVTDGEKKPAKEKVKFSVRFKKFIKDYKSEIKKITWPTRQQVMKNTSVVVGAIIIVATMVGVLDFGFTKGIQLLGDLFQ